MPSIRKIATKKIQCRVFERMQLKKLILSSIQQYLISNVDYSKECNRKVNIVTFLRKTQITTIMMISRSTCRLDGTEHAVLRKYITAIEFSLFWNFDTHFLTH